MKLKDPLHISKGIICSPGEDSCDMWAGALTREGYGDIEYEGDCYFAHYFYYHVTKTGSPEGYPVVHLCGNTWCMNLSHMDTTTNKPSPLLN